MRDLSSRPANRRPARAWHLSCSLMGQTAHDPAPRPAGPTECCKPGPRLPAPARHIPPRASPSLTPRFPQLSPRRGRAPGAAGQRQRDKLSGKRETGAGAIRGRFSAALPLAGSPGGGRRTLRPGGAAVAAPAGRRPPGQRELGRVFRAGTGGRARGWEGGRAPSRRTARERPGQGC